MNDPRISTITIFRRLNAIRNTSPFSFIIVNETLTRLQKKYKITNENNVKKISLLKAEAQISRSL